MNKLLDGIHPFTAVALLAAVLSLFLIEAAKADQIQVAAGETKYHLVDTFRQPDANYDERLGAGSSWMIAYTKGDWRYAVKHYEFYYSTLWGSPDDDCKTCSPTTMSFQHGESTSIGFAWVPEYEIAPNFTIHPTVGLEYFSTTWENSEYHAHVQYSKTYTSSYTRHADGVTPVVGLGLQYGIFTVDYEVSNIGANGKGSYYAGGSNFDYAKTLMFGLRVPF